VRTARRAAAALAVAALVLAACWAAFVLIVWAASWPVLTLLRHLAYGG
jgi:hypothetical protein